MIDGVFSKDNDLKDCKTLGNVDSIDLTIHRNPIMEHCCKKNKKLFVCLLFLPYQQLY